MSATKGLTIALGATAWESQVFNDGVEVQSVSAMRFRIAAGNGPIQVDLRVLGGLVFGAAKDEPTIRGLSDIVIAVGDSAETSAIYCKGQDISRHLCSVSVNLEAAAIPEVVFTVLRPEVAALSDLMGIPWVRVEVVE